MKTGTTIAVIGGGLALLALAGGGVYLATRQRTPAPNQGGTDAETERLRLAAQVAQSQADAAKATADAQKTAAKAAEKSIWEEAFTTVLDDVGDFFVGAAKGGALFG